MPFIVKNTLLKCTLVAKFVIELGFMITLDLTL